MKSTARLLFAFLTIFNLHINGQSLSFTNIENIAWGVPTVDLSVHAYIINTSENIIRIKMKSEEISVANGSQNYFCLNLCYAPGTTESPDFEQLAPGDTLKTFKGYYRANGALDEANIKYTFFNINNITDSIQLIGHYYPSPASIKKVNDYKLKTFPNPANDFMQVSLELKKQSNPTIIIYNSLGKKVYSREILESTNFINISTADFSQGVYYCSISENGKLMKTEKFMVIH
jgi:hypothetical protein